MAVVEIIISPSQTMTVLMLKWKNFLKFTDWLQPIRKTNGALVEETNFAR